MKFEERRALALSILDNGEGLTRRSGQFLGQICADPFDLSDKQADWLAKLAERNGFTMPGGKHYGE